MGTFVTFEGADGTGKSTHIGLLAERLRAHGLEVLCLREPGGTAVGEALRALVLDPANAGLSDRAELLIYEAARAAAAAARARNAAASCGASTPTCASTPRPAPTATSSSRCAR